MSTISDRAGVGSLGLTHPELMTSFRRAQWRMLLAAMFCYLFFYTGRQTFGFAIPGIQAEFGVSKAALGWASAALLWCYAIGQAVNGNLGDKFGGRRVMSAGAILSFIMNWATSLSTGVVSFGLLGNQRLLSVDGMGAGQPAVIELVGPSRTRDGLRPLHIRSRARFGALVCDLAGCGRSLPVGLALDIQNSGHAFAGRRHCVLSDRPGEAGRHGIRFTA
jgi:MFS family permease